MKARTQQPAGNHRVRLSIAFLLLCVRRSSSSPGPPAPCLHSRTEASTPSPGFTRGGGGQRSMKPRLYTRMRTFLSVALTHTHSGGPVGGQLLQEWEGSPVNGFHGPAADRQVTGLTRVQHSVGHAHLASPPAVLRAAGKCTERPRRPCLYDLLLCLKSVNYIYSIVVFHLTSSLYRFSF